jgi:hypothetical protein
MSWRRGIAVLAAATALGAIAVVLNACGGNGGGSGEPGGERTQAVANWLKAHGCEHVTRTNAKGIAPDPNYGLFLERSKAAILVACDKGPEDSALVWEFDDHDTMARSFHAHAPQLRAGPTCTLTHVVFTIENVKNGVGLCRSMLGDLGCGRVCGHRLPDFLTQARKTKADPKSIPTGPCGSRRVKPARITRSVGSVSATQLIFVSAVDRDGCLRPNIDLQSRGGGGCSGGRPNIYSCSYVGPNYVPCWRTVFDEAPAMSIVCMDRLWSPEAYRIDLAPGAPRAFRPPNGPGLDLRYPEELELVNGSRCERLAHYDFYRGPDRRFKGRTTAYSCEKKACVLLNGFDRSAAIWNVDGTCGRVAQYRTIGVRAAWYAA